VLTADVLREKFLAFFKAKKHKIVESDSLVPKDDPTVLFTPAGMNQFKKEFLGFDSGFSRAATSQRCLRTDDLEKVGKTSVHHTFFEMLGNFSFGDYFKKEAINWAWEFLTKELKIPPEKLWVSVYHDDEEAYNIWKDDIKISVRKIIRLGDKDNFWPAEAKTKGPNGPCGPCSEIFYDFGKISGCKNPDCNPACSCGRFAEIWNLVFTQSNRKPDGSLEPLPHKNIDTGMGLERLAAVMQGKPNNFQTDLFLPITSAIEAEIKKSRGKSDPALVYAVSDHIRAAVFSIYDGVNPSNEARGYVIRKIIRKSVLALRSQGIKKPFFYKLVPVVAQVMKKPYPDLGIRGEGIAESIFLEEKNFISALDSSRKLFEDKFSGSCGKKDPEAAGKTAFLLYDTYGIPLELTKGWLDENKIDFSQRSFELAMEEQKVRSKLGSAMKGDVFSTLDLGIKGGKSRFVGYKNFVFKSKVLKIFKGQEEVKKASSGNEFSVVLDATPFYAQSGGQIGDTGRLVKGKSVFLVTDTQRSGKVVVHHGKMETGAFKADDTVKAEVDLERRLSISRNHTATHLLQAALRKVLGAHVKQQGSLVEAERLRFDFTHFKGLSRQELDKVEEIVNNYIMSNHSLDTREMEASQARKTGALAFFADKYSSKVRVVSVADISREFCGGTHISSCGQIGYFKILQESSISSGIRRIEAATGIYAYRMVKEEEALLGALAEKLNASRESILKTLDNRLAEIKNLEKLLEEQKVAGLKGSLEGLLEKSEDFKGTRLIAANLGALDMDLLRKNVDLLKEKVSSAMIALAGVRDNKVFLVVGLTGDLSAKGLDAGKMVRESAEFIAGSGGGRADFAQAGGSRAEGLGAAFDKLKETVKNSI